MGSNQLYLFQDRRFLPIFMVQLLGCFNDSLLKNALIILITYKLSNQLQQSTQMLVLLANAIFVIPFVLFASLAGQVADKYERSTLVRIIKICEILIVFLAIYGFFINNLFILFTSITFMGIHSTFFGPLKYSILPDHLKKTELLAANGFVEAGTFVSILLGTMLGGFYTISANFVIITAVLISVSGFIASMFLDKSNNSNPAIKINYNLWQETLVIMKYSYAKKQVYLAILGISWFWFIGAAFLAQIPSLAKDILGADENVANLFLGVFSIGVGIGSFLCNKLFDNEITTKYLFISAIGISIFGIDLFFASQISAVHYEITQLKSVFVFLSKKHNWRIVIDLFFLAMISGIYVVPLFAVMQYFSPIAYRSRIIAANNLVNALFMAASTILLSIFLYLGFSIPFIILIISILNILIAIYIYHVIPNVQIIPFKLSRTLCKFIFDCMYRVEVKNIENFYKAGQKTVIVSNHMSYIDPALIAVYLPENLTFAIDKTISELPWVKPFLKVGKALPLDTNNAMAIKTLISELKRNNKIAIFPEGRISTTGALMKIYEGPAMIADKADASILPVRIDGVQYTSFSKMRNILRTRLFPKITITILPPVKIKCPENLDNRDRRKYMGQALYDIMADMMFESTNYRKTLFQSLIEAAKIHGFKKEIARDVDGNSVNYRELLQKSFILAELIKSKTTEGEYIGLMLPNMVASLVCFYAVQASGRVPCMVNFTSGLANITSSSKIVGLKIIYTSRKFIKKAELENLIKNIKNQNIQIIYLEDIRKQLDFSLKFKGFLAGFFPQSFYNISCPNHDPKTASVILFTSGTEAKPKAVVLSHQNIQSNKAQILAKLDFTPFDTAMNVLPMFHCFGLNASILMSLSGVNTFYYPSPLHYRIIPELIYDVGATILFGTDTFLNNYAKYAHPYDFYSLRYVFAGAEKLKTKTREFWLNKYGVRIFEGYGVTECSPVIAVNTPMHDLPTSVGRLMPKIEYSLLPFEGAAIGGRLCVKGPNIMLGYIKEDKPGIIQAPFVEKLGIGWYDTGDIVSIDENSYLTIIGRAKRFAKIAGEMVSLSLVEDIATNIDPENIHATIQVEDDNRGEQIVLFTTGNITRDDIAKEIKREGLSELSIPKSIIKLDEIPLLATGKVNYIELSKEFLGKD